MPLAATLTRYTTFKPGNMKWSIAVLASLAQAELEPQPGWIVANGVSLLRAGKYANLFANIGTQHGAVDGTHFSVPDHRDGFSPMAMGPSFFTVIAARGGEYTHAITPSEIPSHVGHGFSDLLSPAYPGSGTSYWNGYTSAQNPSTIVGRTSGAAVGGQGNGANGSTHENLPPLLVVGCVLIKY